MKVLCAVKRVVDYKVNVRPKADETGVDIANVKMSINPFDEIAVEEAVRLKEKGVATEVVVVSIGDAKSEEIIRQSIAIGADRGVLVTADKEIQPLSAAKILAKIIEKEQPKIVILGKQAIDDDSNQTGQILAGLLGWSQATFASEVKIEGENAIVTREVDGGLLTISAKLPAIITTDLRLNEPRYVKLPDIMKARSKPMEKIAVDSLGVDIKPRFESIKFQSPTKRSKGIKVANVDDLISQLKSKQVI
ncbi:MAG: electron transfer flavoprotein subunit beta/FixA family protein [Rickettsiales bacterium]|nr:electron transfer flavoprotein subunit beta/FixA family protein [Rickettsiales bacterium]